MLNRRAVQALLLRKTLNAYQAEQPLLLVGVGAAETNEPGLARSGIDLILIGPHAISNRESCDSITSNHQPMIKYHAVHALSLDVVGMTLTNVPTPQLVREMQDKRLWTGVGCGKDYISLATVRSGRRCVPCTSLLDRSSMLGCWWLWVEWKRTCRLCIMRRFCMMQH
jgi:hypothetical protein